MMTNSTQLTPTRPYLARAIYQWICDNQLVPYLLVDATQKYVVVPTQHIKDGQIVLNIAPHAVGHFQITNDAIQFSARFGGVSQDLYVPMSAVMGIYSRENGQGLFFDQEEYQHLLDKDEDIVQNKDDQNNEQPKKKPSLRVLD